VRIGERRRAGGDGGGRGRSQSEGAESRPGYDVTNFLCTSLEGGAGEASSAGYGREAVKMPVFMPWPQTGRMQYEKIKGIGGAKD
jgi:hypothetical protein